MATTLSWDAWVLFISRSVRMFAFGSVGVILALYLHEVGLPDEDIGLLLHLTLVGDAVISLFITIYADALGRRRMLLIGCALKLLGAAVFTYVREANFWLLAAGATIGVISPSGNEVGPFMALEQSVLSDQVKSSSRTMIFAWYNLMGYVATACGSLAAGFTTTQLATKYGFSVLDSYRVIFAEYGALAVVLISLVLLLTAGVELRSTPVKTAAEAQEMQSLLGPEKPAARGKEDEEAAPPGEAVRLTLGLGSTDAEPDAAAAATAVPPARKGFLGLSKESFRIIAQLSVLFALDSFGSGLVTGTLLAYYFQATYGVSEAYLGGVLFGANVIAGVSSLCSGWVAERFGLVNTMVFTHLPSNILLIMIPLMPSLELATGLVFLRFSISQMDVAPRQSYVSGIVPPEERTATMGITNIVKSLGAAFGPLATGWLAAGGHFGWAFYIAGGAKILYDIALLWGFRHLKADHEKPIS